MGQVDHEESSQAGVQKIVWTDKLHPIYPLACVFYWVRKLSALGHLFPFDDWRPVSFNFSPRFPVFYNFYTLILNKIVSNNIN